MRWTTTRPTTPAFSPTAGAAVLVQQRELSARAGSRTCCSAFTRDELLEMANRARALAKPGATAAVAGALHGDRSMSSEEEIMKPEQEQQAGQASGRIAPACGCACRCAKSA